jgi:hypothetical protein
MRRAPGFPALPSGRAPAERGLPVAVGPVAAWLARWQATLFFFLMRNGMYIPGIRRLARRGDYASAAEASFVLLQWCAEPHGGAAGAPDPGRADGK